MRWCRGGPLAPVLLPTSPPLCTETQDGGGGGGCHKMSGVVLSLCSSRACLHTTCIAISVPFQCFWLAIVPLAQCAAPSPPHVGVSAGPRDWLGALSPGQLICGLRPGNHTNSKRQNAVHTYSARISYRTHHVSQPPVAKSTPGTRNTGPRPRQTDGTTAPQHPRCRACPLATNTSHQHRHQNRRHHSPHSHIPATNTARATVQPQFPRLNLYWRLGGGENWVEWGEGAGAFKRFFKTPHHPTMGSPVCLLTMPAGSLTERPGGGGGKAWYQVSPGGVWGPRVPQHTYLKMISTARCAHPKAPTDTRTAL